MISRTCSKDTTSLPHYQIPYDNITGSSTSTCTTSSDDEHQSNVERDESLAGSKNYNWRTLLINGGGIKKKAANLQALIHDTDPDCFIGNESWLDETIKNGAIFPQKYAIFRKDHNINGGGVFIGTKKKYTVNYIRAADTESEIIWVSVKISQTSKIFSKCLLTQYCVNSK